jgi:hypothetical protein
MLTPAYLGAAGGESAQQLFISCIALFGRWLGRGSASRRWIPTSLETISSSSLSLQVALVRDTPFCSLYGSYASGLFGSR